MSEDLMFKIVNIVDNIVLHNLNFLRDWNLTVLTKKEEKK